jgi:hypothetical protein
MTATCRHIYRGIALEAKVYGHRLWVRCARPQCKFVEYIDSRYADPVPDPREQRDGWLEGVGGQRLG